MFFARFMVTKQSDFVKFRDLQGLGAIPRKTSIKIFSLLYMGSPCLVPLKPGKMWLHGNDSFLSGAFFWQLWTCLTKSSQCYQKY